VLENVVEDYLVKRVEAAGGIAEKTIALGTRGYFDRTCVLPGGRVIFVEVKKPRRSHTTKHQSTRHAAYIALGAEVAVVKNLADVDRLIDRDAAAGVQNAPDLKSSAALPRNKK
jgi:hypothetical protein